VGSRLEPLLRLAKPRLGAKPDPAAAGPGVTLRSVDADSPADAAGLRPGDVIVGFAGHRVDVVQDLIDALDVSVGQIVITVRRGGEPLRLSAQLDAHPAPIECLAWSPDGRLLATGAADGDLRVWDARGGSQQLALSTGQPLTAATFSRDGAWLIAGDADGGWTYLDLARGENFRNKRPPEASTPIRALACDDAWLFLVTEARELLLEPIGRNQQLDTIQLGERIESADLIAFAPDARRLAFLDSVTGLLFSSQLSRDERGRWTLGADPYQVTGGPLTLVFGPQRLWVSTETPALVGLSLSDPSSAPASLTPDEPKRAVAVSPDGRYLALGGDRGLACHDLQGPTGQRSQGLPIRGARCLAFSPDGRLVAAGMEEGHALLFEVR
jgi:WD40 repeat protein